MSSYKGLGLINERGLGPEGWMQEKVACLGLEAARGTLFLAIGGPDQRVGHTDTQNCKSEIKLMGVFYGPQENEL